jgi:hypothetical protein
MNSFDFALFCSADQALSVHPVGQTGRGGMHPHRHETSLSLEADRAGGNVSGRTTRWGGPRQSGATI